VRAVFDPNVLTSGILSPSGNAAWLLRAWERGEFELVCSARLLTELGRALAYPKLRRRVSENEAREALQWLRESGTVATGPISRSRG
jgi:predicted nucleic acid-binding protein